MLVWGIRGAQNGPISPHNTYTLVRARAYNDCAQHTILLKPYSRRGIHGPKMAAILGPRDGTPDSTSDPTYLDPIIPYPYTRARVQ